MDILGAPERLGQEWVWIVESIEYDLHGMIQAYGIDFIHWLANEINHGRVNCKQDVDRWAAHIALQKDYDFATELDQHGHRYGEGELEDFAAWDTITANRYG